MGKSILKRLLYTLIVLIGVSIIAFLLVRLAPGDPARLLLEDTATEEQVQALRIKMGLDKPLIVQYLIYMKGILTGDFGYSYYYKMDCIDVIVKRLPNTVLLALSSLALSMVIAFTLGLSAGIKRGSFIDTFSVFFSLLGQSLSPVWIGILLILIFSVKLRWLPAQGMGEFKNLILPMICSAFSQCALATRMLRSSMIDVLQEDYITAMRARGVSKTKIYVKYAFKNALLPLITIYGNMLGSMLVGSLVIEQVFGWPGLGQLMVLAIGNRDYQLIQSMMLLSATCFVLFQVAVDLVYTVVDKRIKFN